jgi:AraC-like DNA-binding protein
MRYEEILPSRPLAKYVKCFWFLESTLVESGGQERILPDGCTEIVINLAEPFQQQNSDGSTERQPLAFVVGQMRRYLLIEPTGKAQIMGLRFWPGGVYPFLAFPQDQIADQVVALDSIWGRMADELRCRIAEAPSLEDAVRRIERVLVARLSKHRQDIDGVMNAVRLIRASGGRVSVDYLSEQMGISLRMLDRRFNAIVGLPPKVLSRIVRFQRALKMLESRQDKPDWVEIALECGFYDQSHFIKEFKAISGKEPTSYSNETHLMSDHFTRSDQLSFSYNT